MDRDWLATQLECGRSIEDIAREVGRHPSTVAYWIDKYGLESRHAAHHRARGAIPREALEPLIVEGLSIRAIAAELEVSYATVQHWLRRHGLATVTSARRAESREAAVEGEDRIDRECARHGVVPHVLRRDGVALSLASARAEASKCVLLCATCHAEVEAGFSRLRLPGDTPPA